MARTNTNKKARSPSLRSGVSGRGEGSIIRIQGPVIDVFFKDAVPQIFEALEIILDKGKLVLETEFEIGNNEVRTLALGPTEGLRRGQRVRRTKSPIKVPTGEKTLGRIFNVLGETIDGKGPVNVKAGDLEPIHKPAPP